MNAAISSGAVMSHVKNYSSNTAVVVITAAVIVVNANSTVLVAGV